jgi:hypothetical protein
VKLELDRKDNDKGYSPENVRWVTHLVNMNNTRHHVFIPFEGQMLSPAQIEKKTGVHRETIRRRYFDFGITGDKLKLKDQRHTRVLYGGTYMTVKELAKKTGVQYEYLRRSFMSGLSVKETLANHKAGKPASTKTIKHNIRGMTIT